MNIVGVRTDFGPRVYHRNDKKQVVGVDDWGSSTCVDVSNSPEDAFIWENQQTADLPKPSTPTARCFATDMDGTIIETGALQEKAWKQVAKDHGFTWKKDFNFKASAFGLSSKATAQLLFPQVTDEEQLLALVAEKSHKYFALLNNEDLNRLIIPGFRPFIDRVKAIGGKVALVTSSNHVETELILTKTGLIGQFDLVIDSSKVTKLKPDPEPYQIAANLMGFSTYQCVFFEDSYTGFRAGAASGMKGVVIGTSIKPENMPSETSLYIQDYQQLSPSDL
jgi:beta-phosphoglucomutase